jgi:hypothetical protein
LEMLLSGVVKQEYTRGLSARGGLIWEISD